MFNKQKVVFCLLLVFLITICFIVEGWADSIIDPTTPMLENEMIYWYENGVKKKAWIAMDEAAVFPEKGEGAKLNDGRLVEQFDPGAVITEQNEFVIYLKTSAPMAKELVLGKLSSIRALQNVKQASPVFYTDKQRSPAARIVFAGEIIVRFPSEYSESRINTIEKSYGLKRLRSFGFSKNIFLYQAGNPLKSLDTANAVYESGQAEYAYPNWLRRVVKRAMPNDLYFPDQWHLYNTGQGNVEKGENGIVGEDVNIVSVWDTCQGSSNEVIAIVDDGLQIDHEDLAPNIIVGESWNFVDESDNPYIDGFGHGTNAAGVAAGRGFNVIGITGAAPLAGLVGHLFMSLSDDDKISRALTRNNDLIDIYSNSWGPTDGGNRLDGPGPLTEDALESGVTKGRGGLGSIYVWAGGNGYADDNSNYDSYANSRYTIAVAASTNRGLHCGYSERGANILVNAPSKKELGEGGFSEGITTTRPMNTAYGNYIDNFGGTSSSAPLVSGIIALMLQANPNLTWRDVQHILIETAEKIDGSDSDWTTNGAGYWINHKYGFGRIDAQAAVNAALSWTSAAPETSTQGSSSPNLTIPDYDQAIPDDDQTGVTDTIYISDDIKTEFAVVYFTAANHPSWGDLEVILTSPDGTESVLAEKHPGGSSAIYNNWRFGSVRHFGEFSKGDWSLSVRDLVTGNTGTFQSWTLEVYGTPIIPINNQIFLNEGPNLISIPLEQADWSLTSVLASIEGNYSNVCAYIAGAWKCSGSRVNPLTEMSLEYGYWINMTAPDTLEFSGTVPSVTTININSGWNLVGYPSLAAGDIKPVLSFINYSDVCTEIDGVQKCATDTDDPLTEMIAGYGYWINADEAGSYKVGTPRIFNHQISLNEGPTLISIPLEQADWSLTSVLASIEGNYSNVCAYIAGAWKCSESRRNPLTEMSLEYGYWINMTAPDTLQLSGTSTFATTININSGWNLVGYPSLTTERDIKTVLSSINYSDVCTEIGGVQKCATDTVDPLTEMITGYGYWINANEAGRYKVCR